MRERRSINRVRALSYVRVSEGPKDSTLGHALDVTVRGMRLSCRRPMTPDCEYHLQLELPDKSGDCHRITFNARVAWCQRADAGLTYECGVEILRLADSEEMLLERFVADSTVENKWLMVSDCLAPSLDTCGDSDHHLAPKPSA